MTETVRHEHRWTPWVSSPLTATLGVERQRRECPCGVMQDEPVEALDPALGRCQTMLQCHRETDHEGGHEAREGSSSQDLPESMCGNCGGVNPVWAAPSPLWNAVMRGGDINGTEKFGGIICPSCFAGLAEYVGLGVTGWRFIPEHVLKPLQTTTPSGRVWSDAEFRWVDEGGKR